jgi:hypothetical protein
MSKETRWLGLSGVEMKHIRKQFDERGLDFDAVDWEVIGQDSADHGKRSKTIWKKLGSMYGISKNMTNAEISVASARHKAYVEDDDYYLSRGLQHDIAMSFHQKRSKRAIALDRSKRAKTVFELDDPIGVAKWMKHPNRYDLEGVD